MEPWFTEDRTCTVQYTLNLSIPHGTSNAALDAGILVLALIGLLALIYLSLRPLVPCCRKWSKTAWALVTCPHRASLPPVATASDRVTPRLPPARRLRRRDRERPTTPPLDLTPLSPGSLAILTPAHDPPIGLVQALNTYQTVAAKAPSPPLTRARANSSRLA